MDNLSSGVVGLVIGAVLGLALSVLFEDGLKNSRSTVARRLRHEWARKSVPHQHGGFRLGPLQTSVLIIEGDGQHVIDEQAIRVIVEPEEVRLPGDLACIREEISAQQEAQRAAGRDAHWNGPIYAVSGLAVQRLGIDESPGVALRLMSADYFTFLATQQLDRELPDGSTVRRKYLDPHPPGKAPDFMNTSFGTYTAVITADNFAVFCKRSSTVGVFQGLWGVSADEALSRSLDSHGRTPPSLYNVARRGLAEELALGPEEYRLEMLSVNLDRASNQWGCVFTAFLHDVTGAQMLDRRTRGIPDKWEHDEMDLVRFTVNDIVGHLLRPDRTAVATHHVADRENHRSMARLPT